MRDNPNGLGKAALLEHAGVEETSWTAAIGYLRASGRVVQEGAKKGTIYKATPE